MKIAEFVLGKKSLILTIFGFFFLLGILEFFVMPREEDPRLKERFGVLRIIYPGASIESMKRLIVLPTEEAMAEVPVIRTLEVRIRPEVMIAEIRLQDSLASEQEINEAWKRVEDAMKKMEPRFPSGIQPWDLNRRVLDQEAILISVTGSEDILLLKEKNDLLRLELLKLTDVAKVNRLGDPEEEVTIYIPKNVLEAKGVSLRFLSEWVAAANHNIPPGTMELRGKKAIIKTDGWFSDLISLRELPIPLPGGNILTLEELGDIDKKPRNPKTEIMRWNRKLAVGLGVVAKKNINLVRFGSEIEKKIAAWQIQNPQVKVELINSQPRYVASRLSELGGNLLSGIIIVAFVLIAMMGFRVGILSAVIVPVIAIISLGVYGMFGGVLHQISIAAFVMALGLLIDNVIVVLESIQEKIDSQIEIKAAVSETIQRLSFPLFSATGTTLASFIPLLGSEGNSADFTRAIPVINMLTLSVSFFFALFVTPILGLHLLKQKQISKASVYEKISERIGSFIPGNAKSILILAFALFALAMAGFLFVPKKFFPDADRDQLILDLRLPEGTDIQKTNEIISRLESWAAEDKRISSTCTFIGRTVPLFYYNLNQSPNSPHIAQMILNLRNIEEKAVLKQSFEKRIKEELSEGVAILQELKQGPPLKAPIEIRLYSDVDKDLFAANQILLNKLYTIEGLKQIRSDLSVGTPVLDWESDDASLSRYRSTRSDVALSILSQSRGMPLGFYRAGERPIPIVLRTLSLDEINPDVISSSAFVSTRTDFLKLSQVAHMGLSWETSGLYRRNRENGINIYAELKEGVTAESMTGEISSKMKVTSLPKSVRWEFGGEQAESGSANQSLLAVAPLGIMILISFLLLEFGSWKQTGIILLTVPLSMIGVVPGLLLSGKPFGFLSLLGIFALTGIVVNNGILILDYIKTSTEKGESLTRAIEYSLSKRIRPILLTTFTTIAGLLPLAFTSATLWPPFAWTMISGLLVSTLLTLFVIPSATYLIYVNADREENKPKKINLGFISRLAKKGIIIAFLFSIPNLYAQERELTWRETVKRAEESPRVKIAWEEWKRKHLERERLDRAVYYPKLGFQVEQINRDRTLFPNASLPVVAGINPSYWTGGVEVQQTLFDPANWFAVSKALEYSEEATRLLSHRARETSQSESLLHYLTIHRIKIKKNNLLELVQTLSIRLIELKRLYALGQVTESELFRIEQAISQAKIAMEDLSEKEKIANLALLRLLGMNEKISIGELPTEGELRENFDETMNLERLELIALKNKMWALAEQKNAIEYEALPKIVAKGNYIYLNNNQFNTDQWAQISLGLSVNPFDGGIRKTRVEETESLLRSTKEEFDDLVRALYLEKEDAASQVKVKKHEVEIRGLNVTKSKNASRKEYDRMRNGKTNVNSWIDAEILYSEEKDRYDMARIDLLERIVRFRNVIGLAYTETN
jgi:multidrug efflux pump subunit AcrB/outer membrane protein TolC